MISTSKLSVQLFLEVCLEQGLKHVVCSPGSRNAPLVIAFDEHPDISTYVVHDERSAGFFALGLSLALNEAVAVCCTSGSAVLNYFPAVSEAYYQGIPLVVLSADRPERLINQGDGQTIMQQEVFGKHVHGFLQLEDRFDSSKDLKVEIRKVLSASSGRWKGPVHFNFAFEEPLYEQVEYLYQVEDIKTDLEHVPFKLNADLAEKWNTADRKMILLGQQNSSERFTALLSELAADPSVCVLTECTSNSVHHRFNHCIDRSLAAIPKKELDGYRPDLLITFGGAVVSKRIKEFLRTSDSIKEHWNVSFAFPEMDSYGKKTEQFSVDSSNFVQELLAVKSDIIRSNFGSKWKQLDFLNQEKLEEFKGKAEFSDFTAFDIVLDSIPTGTHIHLGNSTPIRYAQLFDPIQGIHYYSNRGTSGIDGSLSTAVGFAHATKNEPNVMITGDVSFFYDSNALWNRYLGSNLKIVLMNNEGGGIFRIIDGPAGTNQLQEYFEAHHVNRAEFICKAFGVEYLTASNTVEVEEKMRELLLIDNSPVLLEIITPREKNAAILKEFFNSLN